MHVITASEATIAYVLGMRHLVESGRREQSRAGEVLVSPVPVSTVYRFPDQRVVLDPKRDANPFFHLLESVWMLAGRRDGRWLDRFVRDFSSRFAEVDGSLHGAYGHRWRSHFGMDQLHDIARMLREDPTTRRAVLTMWDPRADLRAQRRDIPCNTQVLLRARRGENIRTGDEEWLLDGLVCCRSNDAVWGAYGANVVHMSVMLEVLAALSGMGLGTYTQLSMNFHVYTSILDKVWPPEGEIPIDHGHYTVRDIRPLPIVEPGPGMETRAEVLLHECEHFCEAVGRDCVQDWRSGWQSTRWLREVVEPMYWAHHFWRLQQPLNARIYAQAVASPDWSAAAVEWIDRRMSRRAEQEAARET